MTDVHVYHPAIHGVGVNSCEKNKCSHLCLLARNNTYSCACPKSMELDRDNVTCREARVNQNLLMGIGDRLVLFEHQSFGRHSDGNGQNFNFKIDRLAYNSITDEAIAADNEQKAIFAIKMKDYTVRQLIENVGRVSALTFGMHSYLLFCSERKRIGFIVSIQTPWRTTCTGPTRSEAPSKSTVF